MPSPATRNVGVCCPPTGALPTTRVTSIESPPPKGRPPTQFDPPVCRPAVSLSLLPVGQHTFMSVVDYLPTFYVARLFTVNERRKKINMEH